MKVGRPGIPPTTQRCQHCGHAFTAYRQKGKRRRFCTHPCYGKWLKQMHSADYQREQDERDAEDRSWRGIPAESRTLHG